jgi:hypothetical protein
MRWVVLLARVPAEPSRHRVAIWRELRRLGAVAIGQSVWALPDHQTATAGLDRIAELVARGAGELTVLEATGRDQASRERLERLYVAARAAEWTEFRAECARYLAEIDKEIGKGKPTVAELEEEEQSMERLRRWHRVLRARRRALHPGRPRRRPGPQGVRGQAGGLHHPRIPRAQRRLRHRCHPAWRPRQA